MAKRFFARELAGELKTICEGEGLRRASFSRPRDTQVRRETVRVFADKGKSYLQFQRQAVNGKVFHTNVPMDGAARALTDRLGQYDTLNLFTANYDREFKRIGADEWLINRKPAKSERAQAPAGHDKARSYTFPEGKPEPFMVALGIMTDAGAVVPKFRDKFRQINAFMAYVAKAAEHLPEGDLKVADLCCGRSVLSFALYVYLTERLGRNVEMYCVDLKDDVIAHGRAIAQKLGCNMHFLQQDINGFDPGAMDMVVSLHACDIATDIVLSAAIRWGARVVLSSPCCQHQVAAQLKADRGDAFLNQHPILRQRYAEMITDAMRAQVLKAFGYRVEITEFIETEHTHKNLLIRAYAPKAQAFDRKLYEACRLQAQHYAVQPEILALTAPLADGNA